MHAATRSRPANRLILAGLAIILLGAGSASATTHVVTQSGFAFSPADLTVAAGDTVRWDWTGGSHTVTSGASLSDPQVGVLFDDPLNASNTTFTFVFVDPGVIPYFCRPHVGLGMAGTITVEAAAAVGQTPSPALAALLPNTPNPFNPRTDIVFRLAAPARVTVSIHDLAGRLVRALATAEEFPAGVHRVAWTGRDAAGREVAAGTYLSVLAVDGRRTARMLCLVK